MVHEKAKSLSQLYPHKIGALSLRSGFADIGQAAQGEIKRESISVANTGSKSIKIDFTDLPQGLSLKAEPSILPPGKKGEILIELDTKSPVRWGATKLESTLMIDGKKTTDSRLEIRVRILDNFSGLTQEETEQSSLPMVDNNVYTFGILKPGNKIQHTFDVKNLGRKPLVIHKYDTNKQGITVTHPKTVAPGATAKFSVSITTGAEIGEQLYQITFITNSPARPAFNLLISGTVSR